MSAEAGEIVRRQLDRFATPGWTEAPTVPVDMPAEPVTPYSPTQVQVCVWRG